LNFPNLSRSFDATRQAVRFWGYDSAMEAAFFVNDDALKKIKPDIQLAALGGLALALNVLLGVKSVFRAATLRHNPEVNLFLDSWR
ncbi:MAG TPA: DUF1488 family protein, partial [Rhizomicrobium sp.]